MRNVLVAVILTILAAPPTFALSDEAVSVSVDARKPSRATEVASLHGLGPARGLAASGTTDASLVPYANLITRIATEERVEAALVHAIIKAESNYDPLAMSKKGAQGLMQLMPATADRYAVRDPFDPEANIRGGVRYLRFLQDMFPGSLPLALAAYNAGENAVLRHNGIPPYRETQQYVDRVLAHYGRHDAAPPRADAQPDPTRTETPSPPVAIFRVVEADGALTYTNVRPASLSRP